MMVDQRQFRFCPHKPRVFVTSDIANEPDDAQSLVRFLLYGNEFDIKGLVACTSTWMRTSVHPEQMEEIINAYGRVVSNLNAHVHPDNQYPAVQELLSLLRTGPSTYGKRALDPSVPLSSGAELLIEQLAASDEPLWVLCWGGTNVLAQALHHLHQAHSDSMSIKLRARLRVYAISDQDDTGLWIRITYPDIFYICSSHGWNNYALATWSGISGDLQGDEFPDFGGPDTSKVTAGWLNEHIQIGPLGAVYPDSKFIMEGDTPTFLYLVQNGLGCPDHPEMGSWGGRYVPVDVGFAARHYSDAADRVVGKDGMKYVSNRATIWRWRDAYQNDFAARVKWTLSPDQAASNHAPVVVVNGSRGPEPLSLSVEAGAAIILDASDSYDPDGDQLTFSWFQYREPTSALGAVIDPQIAGLEIVPMDSEAARPSGRKVKVTLPGPEKCAIDFVSGKAVAQGQALHVILEVKDDGAPCLYSYKRVIIQVTNEKLLGGRDKACETVMESLQA
ncbi:uncharacterized protein DSM5745_06316 [Aspergillus mulundensis]|uniref:Cellulose-binding protein n=1 Tax=Aspergillus mulundensis TaxID=1810919 RepID=A0A3D8RR31_9EURO|nr:Uncharacterized protein DSM5745_06316 [Aspergillus mulundensis]RDW76324.1 Uncharacterized protein DSM5745_06316 [Aspergillus mulundensis]